MRLGVSKNNFMNWWNKRHKLNDAMRRKWMGLNSLYGDDFKWAWGMY